MKEILLEMLAEERAKGPNADQANMEAIEEQLRLCALEDSSFSWPELYDPF